MSLVCLTRATLLDPEILEFRRGSLLLEGDRIAAVLPDEQAPPEGARVIELDGAQIAPGFIDLHEHGEAVLAPASNLANALIRDATSMLRHGVTGFLATSVAWSRGRLGDFVDAACSALGDAASAQGAQPLGLHLEGPWINPEAAGAQPVKGIRPYDPAEGADLLARSAGILRMVTLAPEIDGSGTLLDALSRSGVVAALGHSCAPADCIESAMTHGMTHVTHLFNAMAPLHHRQPGPAGVTLGDDRLTCDLICDGVHVHPTMVRVAARAAAGRLALITDRLAAPPSSPDSASPSGFGSGELRDDGQAWRLPDGRLAGSTLQLDRALANVQAFGAMTQLEAIAACTRVPARILGIEAEYGSLTPGSRADLAILDSVGRVRETWLAGRCAHRADPPAAVGS